MSSDPEIFIRRAAFCALGDRVALRDPAGRSAHPHLVQGVRHGEAGVIASGPFLFHQRYTVPKADGVRFCRATGDDNKIHSEGNVVPGAYTAAKILLPIEVLFPELEIARFSMKFSSISSYDRPIFTLFHCAPAESGGATFRATTSQDGAPIAAVEVDARRTPEQNGPAPAVARRKVNVERLRAVRAFIRSLYVAPHVYFRSAARSGYYYPRSFLAALPSGAMVRQLRGEGGLLNKLTLEFDGARVAITRTEDPTVEIERPKVRRTFNKILAAITDGIKTYVRGSALVLSREAAAAASAALGGGGQLVPLIEPSR